MIYVLLLLSVFVFYPLCTYNYKSIGNKWMFSEENQKKNYCLLTALFMIVIIGCRSVNVGIDTLSYADIFSNVNFWGLKNSLNTMDIEQGYIVLQYFLGRIGGVKLLLIVEACVLILPFTIIVYKYSRMLWFSFFIFITFDTFIFSLSGIRQSLAIGCTMVAFLFIKRDNLVGFLLSALLAISFHMTAIFFLPAYWLNKMELSRKNIIIFIIGIIGVFLFSDSIFQFLNSNARLEYNYIETGGTLMFVFQMITLCIGIFYRKALLQEDKNNKFFFYALFVTIAFFPLTRTNPTLFRMTYYYSAYMTLFIPNMFSVIKDKGIRWLLISVYIVIFLYYFIFKTNLVDIQVLPYYFFWQ